MSNNKPKVFISYSWDSEEHKEWVINFADRLLGDKIEVHLDEYDLQLGDRLTQFMEKSIKSADYVLIICTPIYKEKADNRVSGVGYEGHIISAELMTPSNERKFIPIIRMGNFETAIPNFLLGKYAANLSAENINFEKDYTKLLDNLRGKKNKTISKRSRQKRNETNDFVENDFDNEPIRILKIIKEEMTLPRMDGTPGCALYKIPFRLSRRPSELWIKIFLQKWEMPSCFTSMHRPDIASVYDNKIILNGTTIEEVKKYHKATLELCIAETNEEEKKAIEFEQRKRKKAEEVAERFRNMADEIEF